MPQEVFTAEIELKVSILEAGGADGKGPYPMLALTGRTERRTFETVVLENEFLTAAFVPDLGGRLISLVDKTSGVEALGSDLTFVEAGPRGMHAFGGIEVTLNGAPRMNALGHVRYLTNDHGVCFAESVAGNGLSYHLHASLDGALLRYAFQVRNRTLRSVPWNPGLLWPSGLVSAMVGPVAEISGFAVIPIEGLFADALPGQFTCFEAPRQLAPRWGDTINLAICPTSNVKPIAISEAAALGVSDAELVLAPHFPTAGAKLLLQAAGGQTMEASADLSPSAPLRYTLSELGGMPQGFVLLAEDRRELLRYPPIRQLQEMPPAVQYVQPEDLHSLDFEPATRYWGAHLRAREAFRRANFESAEHAAEEALLYNGDDPIAWIEKAIAARLAGTEDEEAPELPNAHFLAPLDPLLRSEGFLSRAGLDATTFLSSLMPNDLLEATCHYLDLGLFGEAARFIDGALTVADLPMLRYLYGYCCIATGKLPADAAAAVAGVTTLAPPYPWRPIERLALTELIKRFPNMPVLERYLAVSEAGGGIAAG